ncbi:MAG: hypothetical protein ACLUSP_06505 [Christensenellales bacterium]
MDGRSAEVTGKAEYTVKFRAVEVEYTVTFVVNGGDEIAVASRTIFAAYTPGCNARGIRIQRVVRQRATKR